MSSVRESWKIACPRCGDDQRIDICAAVWVRLTPDGTDVMGAANGDHEWSEHSTAECQTCGHSGTLDSFEAGEAP